jgi:prepilin peptidase CpaA
MMDDLVIFLFIAFLALCAAVDIIKNKIPNTLTMSFAVSAIALHSVNKGVEGFLFSAAGMATGIGLLLIFYLTGGMGAGDVKLMGAVGSLLGAKATLEAFILIALVGGVYSLAIILINREIFKGFFKESLVVLSNMMMLRNYLPIKVESSGQKPRLKYGVAIALGTIAYLFLKSVGIEFLV